jgi:hypothetical protein
MSIPWQLVLLTTLQLTTVSLSGRMRLPGTLLLSHSNLTRLCLILKIFRPASMPHHLGGVLLLRGLSHGPFSLCNAS